MDIVNGFDSGVMLLRDGVAIADGGGAGYHDEHK